MNYIYTRLFERMQEVGAERHPALWYTANRFATNAARECNVDITDPQIKALVSAVTLRVLDATKGHKKNG